MYSQVLDNFWNKPTYKKPYYYIHNVNTSNDSWVSENDPHNGESRDKINAATVPTNSKTDKIPTTEYQGNNLGTDGNGKQIKTADSFGKSINIGGSDDTTSNVERGAAIRYGNTGGVRLEIRYGTDDSVFQLSQVYIDYIKAPQTIRLTQLELDKTEDISQMLEYPDYVCQEIINELVHLIMENISDQRLQTHPVVSQSIANPVQQQTEPVAQQAAQ